jgi:hypothetical protein
MVCKKYKKDMILYLYGELDADRKAALGNHIIDCADCRQELEYTKKVFAALDDSKPSYTPEGDWEKYWEIIQPRTFMQTSGKRTIKSDKRAFSAFPRWGYVAAALMLVFLLGIFAGRIWFFPDFQDNSRDAQTGLSYKLALNEHLDELKPYVLEYANYSSEENGGQYITVDKKLVQHLLIQNVLFKKALAEKNPSAAQLLEDIDLMLQELANMESGDEQTPSMIRELIQKRDILFKMEVLQII